MVAFVFGCLPQIFIIRTKLWGGWEKVSQTDTFYDIRYFSFFKSVAIWVQTCQWQPHSLPECIGRSVFLHGPSLGVNAGHADIQLSVQGSREEVFLCRWISEMWHISRLPVFVSPFPYSQAWAVNALPCPGMLGIRYLYPSNPLLQEEVNLALV